MASTTCGEIPDGEVKYVNATFVDINPEEYNLVSKLLNTHYNTNELVTALSYIGRDDEVFCNNMDDFYDIEEDTNRDGKVTYREIGNSRLTQMYKN